MGKKNRFYCTLESFHKEVSGSRNLCVFHFPDGSKRKILVDCGLNQEAEYEEFNYSLGFKAQDIDYVLITHTHIDHIGLLPVLVKEGYRGEIITSSDTSYLMRPLLMDTCKIQKAKTKSYRKLKRKSSGRIEGKLKQKFNGKGKSKDRPKSEFKFKASIIANKKAILLFNEDDVYQTFAQIQTYPLSKTIHLDENIKVTLFPNNHVPGAVIVLLQASYHNYNDANKYKDINILFTGDYNNKNTFLDFTPLPKWVHQLPIHIVQESTYGNSLSSDIDYVFKDNILEAISERKEILIPALSLARYQEALLQLKLWQDEGSLDKSIPIYCDGNLGIHMTKIFLSGVLHLKEETTSFLPENVHFVTNSSERKSIVNTVGCKIIVTTSGMGDHGPSQFYIPIFLARKNALIHFTCYLAHGTTGRKLFDARKDDYIEIFGMKIRKNAQVKFTFEFSTHAKKDENLNFLRDFENILTVSINHGSLIAKDVYSTAVLNEIDVKDQVCILGIGYYFMLDGYGFINSHSTHSLQV